MPSINPGTLVVHPNKPEWGPGKVVKCDRESVWVFWRDAGDGTPKKMVRSVVNLQPAPSQNDPTLDNLPPLVSADGSLSHLKGWVTLNQAIARFLARFPGGFYDEQYLGDSSSGERRYKEAAHRDCVARLGAGQYQKLLTGDRATLVEELKRVYRSVNLISPYEKAAITDALEDASAAAHFLESLGKVIESPEPTETTFRPYLKAVCDLPTPRGRVATWPVATLIPYLMFPDRHLFLKPTVTENAATMLGFNLNYNATPNWLTYHRLVEMGRLYMDRLADLKPRDMIDVQSFFWVACGGYDRD